MTPLIDPLRQEIAATAHTVVVKIGSRPLTRENGTLDLERIGALAEEIHQIASDGRRVVLVSSGAVSAGMGQLSLESRPRDLAHLQAVAAVGQTYLVQAYDLALRRHGRHAAQVLLTAEDLEDRTRYLNVRNTLLKLLELGSVPIINENDTVSVEELQTTFGDNDRLAALVTNLIRAPLLVILSDVDGLFDRDPREPGAEVVPTVMSVDESIFSLASNRGSGLGKGGMQSKLRAAHIATSAGENVIIANGRSFGSLTKVLQGELIGTAFLAQGSLVTARKRWIGFSVNPRGHLVVDEGARRALVEQGSSLLAIGITGVEGDFIKGDLVAVHDSQGREFARGLINYAAEEVARIRGVRTTGIAERLGHCPYQEVIHRDNLAITS